MFLHLCKCSPDLKSSLKSQLRSESAFAASGPAGPQQLLQRQHALPWLITQNHLYSPPLTFHPCLYHWAILPNCTVQCNCIHYYAKKQPLTLKHFEKDTLEPFCMAHNHCLLYNQSQNNISKETISFFKTDRQVKPSKPLWQIDSMWRPIRACSFKVSICHWKVLFGGLSASLTGRGQWIEGMRKLLLGEVARKCWMTRGK